MPKITRTNNTPGKVPVSVVVVVDLEVIVCVFLDQLQFQLNN
ncbi:MAG: hypothetical protein ACXAC6_18810 [Candidatus Hodarchaeales archaeon]